MEESKRGGKRRGAGRKPIANKKKQISLYVENNAIFPFGNEEKMKEKLYGFIADYSKPKVVNMAIQDLTKPTNEIKPQEQPKTNYSVDTTKIPVQPLQSQYEAYRQRILKTTLISEVEAIMKEVKAALLTIGEKRNLEAIAKEHSRTMYTD